MEEIHINYKGKDYFGTFKIRDNFVIVRYNEREKGTHCLGNNPKNITAQRVLAKQLLEDLIRPAGEVPSYLSKSLRIKK